MRVLGTIEPTDGSILVVKVPSRDSARKAAELALAPFCEKFKCHALIIPDDWSADLADDRWLQSVGLVRKADIVKGLTMIADQLTDDQLALAGLCRKSDGCPFKKNLDGGEPFEYP